MVANILHIDMDCFFVSVERLTDTALRGVPVGVATDDRRSVLASASYEARKYGVKSAMAVAVAKNKCPSLRLVAPNMQKYTAASKKVFEIFRRFTPKVEPVSVDEAFLDVSGAQKLFGTPVEIAHKIRAVVQEELGLPCSVGVAHTKFIAKIASGLAKPNGVLAVPEDKTLEFLHPLPVHKVWGIGPQTSKKLAARAIYTVGDLAQQPQESLTRLLGKAAGASLYHLARGVDPRAVTAQREIKSISNESTFDYDTADPEHISRALALLCAKVARRLRAGGFEAATIGISVRWSDFTRSGHSVTLPEPTAATMQIYKNALKLYERLNSQNFKVRLLGIRASNLKPLEQKALALWQEESELWSAIDNRIDRLQEKLEDVPIMTARLLNSPAAKKQKIDTNAKQKGKTSAAGKAATNNDSVVKVENTLLAEKRYRQNSGNEYKHRNTDPNSEHTNAGFAGHGHAGGFWQADLLEQLHDSKLHRLQYDEVYDGDFLVEENQESD